MNSENPFAQFLNSMVIARLTLLPIALQIVRGNFPVNAAWAGVVNAAVVVALTVWGGIEAHLSIVAIVAQSILAWAFAETFYQKVVKPVANSDNPVLPKSKEYNDDDEKAAAAAARSHARKR
jgi:hypothetical protein